MSTSPNKRDDSPIQPKPLTAVVLLQTVGDTTWRMAVPLVGGTLLGVWLDGLLGTKPWIMFAGILLGAACAGLLIARQLRAVEKQE